MTPKPYKENKSALKDFLEKNNLAPVPKAIRDKKVNRVSPNKYYLLLRRLAEKATEEDLARLEAVAWDSALAPNKKINKYQWERVTTMREYDGLHNPLFPWTNPTKKVGYYVAGERYESREHFLLSRTGLGKELL